MPSHNIHRFCAFLIGLSEDIASHVDSIIDSGTCFVHDVGLEDAVTFINGEACIVFGVHAAIYCLYKDEKLSEDSLKALALHMLLDCIDRKSESFKSTPPGSGRALQRCLSFIENRLTLLPALKGEGSCYCGEVWDYIPSSRGFNPGPGLRPITPTPDGAWGYEYVVCSY